jgi:pimeloyl-ACP methyl ester carboxylesterase
MYRQVSLTALRANLSGGMTNADRDVGYRDVLAAWKHYLEHDNNNRGVVLVGHSQGSGVLTRLLAAELDKEDHDKRFISALLLGTTVTAPKGKIVGGTFKQLPTCTKDDELGCVIVYASFRSNLPPPDDSYFALSSDDKQEALCTNPAALGGGSAELHSYLSNKGPGTSAQAMGDWVKDGPAIETPFVSVPGLLTGACKADKSGSFLEITVKGNPDDPRTDDIVGDVYTNNEVSKPWGLHLIDANLTMGNLLDLVHKQSEAYGKQK